MLKYPRTLPTSIATKYCRGLTLLEILIALVVLSIGLLGLAHLQLFGLESTNDSSRRSMVGYIANDLADRMRINRRAALSGSYYGWDSNDFFGADRNVPLALPVDPGCRTGSSSCSAADIATLDKRVWLDNFVNVNNTLGWTPVVDSVRGQVQRSGTRVRIVISWKSTEAAWDATANERTTAVVSPTFDLEFDL